jgi:hypothetical protein
MRSCLTVLNRIHAKVICSQVKPGPCLGVRRRSCSGGVAINSRFSTFRYPRTPWYEDCCLKPPGCWWSGLRRSLPRPSGRFPVRGVGMPTAWTLAFLVGFRFWNGHDRSSSAKHTSS